MRAAIGLLAAALVALGVLAIPSSRLGRDTHAAAAPTTLPTTTTTTPAVAQIGATGSTLVIPALGVHAPIVPTGAVGAPGTAALTIPSDVSTVGWWDGTVSDGVSTIHEGAPAPGQPGVAVIAGHINSHTTPGALYQLAALGVDDTIEVFDSAGNRSTWTVDAPPQTVLKSTLPAALWVTTGPPELAVVTCGGPFDAATGHYLDNIIVWAHAA